MRELVKGCWLALAAFTVAWMVPSQAADDVAGHLKEMLKERFPSIKVDVVQPAPVPGLYEIIAGDQVVYVDRTGDYLLVGRLRDTRTRHDLSAEHLDASRTIDFHTLPFEKAIKIVKGNGKRQLAMFADPDCPYCQQLEKDMKSVTDVTVYVFLYPLEQLHPNATAHAHAIWCSPNRSAAWTDWLIDHKDPPASACDSDPIKELQTLGASMRIDTTPTLFLQNGHRVGGAVSADELQKLLTAASDIATGGSNGSNKRTARTNEPAVDKTS